MNDVSPITNIILNPTRILALTGRNRQQAAVFERP